MKEKVLPRPVLSLFGGKGPDAISWQARDIRDTPDKQPDPQVRLSLLAWLIGREFETD